MNFLGAKMTIKNLYEMKAKGEKIVMITAYDALFSKIFDEHVDMILLGDSLNMSFGGCDSTIGLSVENMIYHAKAMRKAIKHAYFVVDMPFGSCATPKLALKNCIKVYEQTGCDAIKIEGGSEMNETIKLLANTGIAVMSHIGLKPQHARKEGGFFVKKDEEKILSDARVLENSGANFLLIEGVISSIASKVASASNVPVISIGAGSHTDGQVLVWSDMLGFFTDFKPKFVKRYLNGAQLVQNAVKEYAKDVREKKFPAKEHEYEL